jgi:hypothetical protein
MIASATLTIYQFFDIGDVVDLACATLPEQPVRTTLPVMHAAV